MQEVPVLLGAAAEPLVPENDAAVPDGAFGGDGGGMLLLGDPDGGAGGASVPGCSLCKPGSVHHRLAQAGIHQTFQPVIPNRILGQTQGSLTNGEIGKVLQAARIRDPVAEASNSRPEISRPCAGWATSTPAGSITSRSC